MLTMNRSSDDRNTPVSTMSAVSVGRAGGDEGMSVWFTMPASSTVSSITRPNITEKVS